MENKDLIIWLIQQDLKHSQLMQSLRQIGLDDGGLHTLDIMSIVARLMHVPEGKVSDLWGGIYGSFLDGATLHEVSYLGEELMPIAENCYELLLACTENENRIN